MRNLLIFLTSEAPAEIMRPNNLFTEFNPFFPGSNPDTVSQNVLNLDGELCGRITVSVEDAHRDETIDFLGLPRVNESQASQTFGVYARLEAAADANSVPAIAASNGPFFIFENEPPDLHAVWLVFYLNITYTRFIPGTTQSEVEFVKEFLGHGYTEFTDLPRQSVAGRLSLGSQLAGAGTLLCGGAGTDAELDPPFGPPPGVTGGPTDGDSSNAGDTGGPGITPSPGTDDDGLILDPDGSVQGDGTGSTAGGFLPGGDPVGQPPGFDPVLGTDTIPQFPPLRDPVDPDAPPPVDPPPEQPPGTEPGEEPIDSSEDSTNPDTIAGIAGQWRIDPQFDGEHNSRVLGVSNVRQP